MHDEPGERAVGLGGGMASPGDAFHRVIPSIPGYGFSGPARDDPQDLIRPGWPHCQGEAEARGQRHSDVHPQPALATGPTRNYL
jgi:hypothetical protein